ncbi:aminoglycoside phosphotransferase family protein [Kitasatospora sp. NPDC058965]|uniref:aminoglycoside phosphotransferase family protein n=1 Tax=Kitasatospora sp. NPDC058965 TaxID=3346682 RepID=UPI003674D50B
MTLHENEITLDEAALRALLRDQRPEWADLPLTPAGAGTDNRMYRLGDRLLLRMPRTPNTAADVRKEQEWLPRLAPHLPCRVPEPVYAGLPGPGFPLAWSVYRWLDGAEVSPASVTDWPALGADLAAAVRSLHATPLMGARRGGDLSWYRGGSLRDCDGWVGESFDACAAPPIALPGLARLRRIWRDALALPEPTGPHVWLHGDLKPSNLLAADGALHAIIDFGGLSIGHPDAEHAPVWDLPAPARQAYWAALDLDEPTWLRARAWAVGVAVSGVAYYWHTDPAFVAECRARLDAVLEGAG